MNARELILLSPYRLPGANALMLGNEDIGAFLSGWSALWHPAALHGATALPKIGSPYDYEAPSSGHLYAAPDSPPLLLPDDWRQRVHEAGALAFDATADRGVTFDSLKAALVEQADDTTRALLTLDAEQVAPFLGLGFGCVALEGLFEAMEHENLLPAEDLLRDVQQAVAAAAAGNFDACRQHLKAAAERLVTAREVVYPASIHLLDLYLPDESRLGEPLPASFDLGLPCNLLACGALLEKLGRNHPERLAVLRERVAAESAEVVGGSYLEREDAALPIESQIWNLMKGQAVTRELTGKDVQVFGRKRFGFHPQLPSLLNHVGLRRVLLVAFDDSVLPANRATVINWPAPDGKQVEAFTRTPYAADNPQTFFHVAHYLHQTVMQDHAATLALLHTGQPAAPWYRDWLELNRLAPVLGQWTTFSRYFNEVLAGEYVSASSPDDFHADYLSERTNAHRVDPVSWFARHARGRRRLDTARSLIAIRRGIGPQPALAETDGRLARRLEELEDRLETVGADDAWSADMDEAEREAADLLADRLLSRAAENTPGYLVLNPCSFKRRVALELPDVNGPLPLTGPLKAFQAEPGKARLVVEVPALGFAWVPRNGPPGTPPPPQRMKLADRTAVRNEFFEAEIDPATGGLRGIRDHRTRMTRVAQQLVWNPGSQMQGKEIRVLSEGPALGEIVSEGEILDEQRQPLATFRQRFRAWLGRPALEMRIEIFPNQAPEGYPWHAYYGARFAWRDERAALLRGVLGTGHLTNHTRPETPDFLDIRLGDQSTVILPGGLPFHQRHGGRMVDVILIPEGETARAFDLTIALDRDYPGQTALGALTPAVVVPTTKGPPHIGATGWLFHLDAPNLLLTSLRPGPEGADAVLARMLECSTYGGQAEWRSVRDPRRAEFLDVTGHSVMEVSTQGDAAVFDVSASELALLRVDYGG